MSRAHSKAARHVQRQYVLGARPFLTEEQKYRSICTITFTGQRHKLLWWFVLRNIIVLFLVHLFESVQFDLLHFIDDFFFSFNFIFANEKSPNLWSKMIMTLLAFFFSRGNKNSPGFDDITVFSWKFIINYFRNAN